MGSLSKIEKELDELINNLIDIKDKVKKLRHVINEENLKKDRFVEGYNQALQDMRDTLDIKMRE